jgi:ABC-type Fe3+-hydroxamate transport system substrate-binding protein
MKFRLLPLVLLIALTLISVVPLAAQDTPEGFPLTIVDRLGRELTFDSPPERIVTYYNDSYGMLATIGLMPVAQSVNPEMLTDPIYFAGQGADITTIPWSDAPDLEAVAAAQPDLVMVYSVEEANALEGIAPAFVTYDPATLDALYAAVQQYGVLFARQEAANAAVTAFQERFATYASLAPRTTTVLKLGVMDEGAFYISTVDDPICQILNVMAVCEWEKATPDEFWGYETTLEGVLELDPDVIILNNWSSLSREDMLAALDANPLWNELRAVQAGRVIGTPGYENPIASSLPAATKFLDTYLPLIYPDIFPAPLTDEQVQEILAGESARSYSIMDVNGNTLIFDAPPTRFVSVGNRDVEMLAALGIQPVGVADIGYMIEMLQDPVYYPEPFEFAILPLDEETFEPDLEALLALNPDVVFGSEEQRVAAQDIDLNVYAFYANNGPGTWQQGLEELRKLAALTGREEQAEAIIAQFEARLAAYKALAPMDRSVMLVGAASATEFYISTEVSGRCAIIREVATCPWPDPTGGESWSYITTLEAILAFNPDVIILDNWGEWSDEDMNTTLAASPLWNELTAVQEGRVTPVLGSHNYSQGVGPLGNMRWLDLYMPVIYPEVFPAPLTDEEVAEILAETE